MLTLRCVRRKVTRKSRREIFIPGTSRVNERGVNKILIRLVGYHGVSNEGWLIITQGAGYAGPLNPKSDHLPPPSITFQQK